MTAAIGLSDRLRAVAEAIPRGARVADIGTDHGWLLAWLVHHGRVRRAIGIDVVPGPLRHAQATIDRTGCHEIELRLGDGLRPLAPGEVDAVSIAGMGGARIIRLLGEAAAVVRPLDRLVLQPNTDWIALRTFVAAQRWSLLGERMVHERGKFYCVFEIGPQPGAAPQWTDDERDFGPTLVHERPPEFLAWLRHESARVRRAYRRATAASEPDTARLAALRRHDERIRALLDGDASPR